MITYEQNNSMMCEELTWGINHNGTKSYVKGIKNTINRKSTNKFQVPQFLKQAEATTAM